MSHRKQLIPWDDQLLTGIRVIDEQHKELFEEVNNFLNASVRQQGHTVLRKFFAYVERYMREHFEAEEELMEMLGDEEKKRLHKSEHRAFEARVQTLREETRQYTPAIVAAIGNELLSWLKTHVPKFDQPLAEDFKKLS